MTLSPPAIDGLPPALRRRAMLGICLGVMLSSLDIAVANVALPAISLDLAASPAASIWVVTAYQITVIASLLPFAALGEIVGYRRVYWPGMALFMLASLTCALAPNLPLLIAARAVQGVAGAAMLSVSMAMVRLVQPSARLGAGLALYALTAAASQALGPTVAALVLSLGRWPWLFAVNLPIGLLSIAVAARILPDNPRAARRFDVPGALLAAAVFSLLILGLGGLGHERERIWAVVALAVAAGLGLALAWVEARQPTPLLPLDLLKHPLFSLSAGTSICAYAAQAAAFVALPFVLHGVMGRSQAATGLLMTPWPLMIVAMAPVAGRLSDRWSIGVLSGTGLLAMGAGIALLALMPAHAATADIVWRTVLCGVGFGLFQTPNNRAMMTAAPPARSGAASGMVAVVRMLGMAVGSAVAAVAFGLFGLGGGMWTLGVAAGFAGAAAALSFARG